MTVVLTTTVLLTIGAGMLLGLRFKALVLCPAIIAAAIATAGMEIVAGNPIVSIALDAGLVAMALQVGYIGGCIIRLPLQATGFPHHHRSSPLGY